MVCLTQRFKWLWNVFVVLSSATLTMANEEGLKTGMPHVCERDVVEVVSRQEPCKEEVTRMVRVWKPYCNGKSRRWCVDYEKRIEYKDSFRTIYEKKTVKKVGCCDGWRRMRSEPGCNYDSIYTFNVNHGCLRSPTKHLLFIIGFGGGLFSTVSTIHRLDAY